MRSPLPSEWVDRLFGRLAVRYGSAWLRQWEGIDMAAVRADWAEELAGLQERPDALRYGLENLPADKPPTVSQFRAACNRAPEKFTPQLAGPPASAAMVAKVRAGLDRSGVSPLAWAHRLKARHESGARLTITQVEMYRSALATQRVADYGADE